MIEYNSKTSFASSASRTSTFDSALRDYMVKVYQHMSVALVISALVAFLVSSSPQLMQTIFGTPLAYVVMFAPLIFVIFFGFKLNYFNFKIDMKKIQLEIMKPFITNKLNSLMPVEDEVIIEYVFSQLEQSQVPSFFF